jgi:hypothetical protein
VIAHKFRLCGGMWFHGHLDWLSTLSFPSYPKQMQEKKPSDSVTGLALGGNSLLSLVDFSVPGLFAVLASDQTWSVINSTFEKSKIGPERRDGVFFSNPDGWNGVERAITLDGLHGNY